LKVFTSGILRFPNREAAWNAESSESRDHALHGKGSFGVYGRLKSIVKHRIWELGKIVSCAKTGRPITTICMPYDGRDDCTCAKILVALIFRPRRSTAYLT